jgi:hypothetical protein
VDRKCPLAGEPHTEDYGQDRREDARAHYERNAQTIREDVGVERAGHAEHDDRQPVDERHVAVETQLPLKGRVDTATPTGRAVVAIMATLAELELELGRERRAASRESRRARRLPATKPPELSQGRQQQLC